MVADSATPPLLDVAHLSVQYLRDAGPVVAVDDVSFRIEAGGALGLVGESGSGKSTLVLALLRLLAPPGVITGGAVHLDGQDLLALDQGALRAHRGRKVGLVPQSGMNALNPLLRVKVQIADALLAHEKVGWAAAFARAAQLAALVGLAPASLARFPHELSGGMRQRVAIAMALACGPRLLILDESTAALDLVVQREILSRIAALRAEMGFAVLFVSHDLPLALTFCDRLGVLHAGRLVEVGTAQEIRAHPKHPYTERLLATLGPEARGAT